MNRISKVVAILSLFSLASMDAFLRTGQERTGLTTLGQHVQPAATGAQVQPGRLNRVANATKQLGRDLREYADCSPNCSKKLMASMHKNKKIIAGTALAVGAVVGAYGLRKQARARQKLSPEERLKISEQGYQARKKAQLKK